MVKSGDKTLTLSGANSYSGATVSGGTLICHSRQRAGYGRYRQPRQPVAGRQRPVYGNGSHHRKRRQHRNRRRQHATGDHADTKKRYTLTINLDSNTADPVIHAASQVSLAGTLDITGVGDVLSNDPASTDDLDTFTLITSR